MRTVTITIDTPWAETLEAAAILRGMTLEALALTVLRHFAETEVVRHRRDAAAGCTTHEAAPAQDLLLAEEPRPPYPTGPDRPSGTGQ